MTNLGWLVATTTMTGLMWLPYMTHRLRVLGPRRYVANPRPQDDLELAPWARRAKQAHANAIENLAVYAPLAVAVELVGADAAWAGATYFVARLGHYVLYTAGIPFARMPMFVTGVLAQCALALAALTSP